MANEAEFEEFALVRAPQLYRAAWLLCGDSHGAEDLVQETLAKVYVRWRRPLAPRIDNPAAYAHQALVRTFLSDRRRPRHRERPVDVLPDTGTSDPDASLRVALARALAGLAPVDRAVVVLRYLDDLSVEVVAGEVGLSPGAVRNRSMRALARVRDALGSSYDELALADDPTRRSTS